MCPAYATQQPRGAGCDGDHLLDGGIPAEAIAQEGFRRLFWVGSR